MTDLVKEANDMSLSFWHSAILLLVAFVFGYPVSRILGRLGLPKVLVVLAFIPLINWIALWVLAYAEWPAVRRDSENPTNA